MTGSEPLLEMPVRMIALGNPPQTISHLKNMPEETEEPPTSALAPLRLTAITVIHFDNKRPGRMSVLNFAPWKSNRSRRLFRPNSRRMKNCR